MAADEYYIFTGREAVPRHVTRVRIHKSITVIPARAFNEHPNIEEVECHIGVKKVEDEAFSYCPSLRRVIMPGVKKVERYQFFECPALTDVECGELEIISGCAFEDCESLRSIDLPSAKIVEAEAFASCTALTNVNFDVKLESIRSRTFYGCTSLERITLPLKDGMITDDNIFRSCKNLVHVDLIEEAILHETVAALLFENWQNDMYREIDSINQILPNTPAGNAYGGDDGGKARAIRRWIRSVLLKIVQYKAEHRRLLNEVAATLQLALPNDIVFKNVLPFLELPSYTFEGED
eukprot:scaffold35168_cov144-Skeletonema_dohrnii-CCMP3373.AAC.1